MVENDHDFVCDRIGPFLVFGVLCHSKTITKTFREHPQSITQSDELTRHDQQKDKYNDTDKDKDNDMSDQN